MDAVSFEHFDGGKFFTRPDFKGIEGEFKVFDLFNVHRFSDSFPYFHRQHLCFIGQPSPNDTAAIYWVARAWRNEDFIITEK